MHIIYYCFLSSPQLSTVNQVLWVLPLNCLVNSSFIAQMSSHLYLCFQNDVFHLKIRLTFYVVLARPFMSISEGSLQTFFNK